MPRGTPDMGLPLFFFSSTDVQNELAQPIPSPSLTETASAAGTPRCALHSAELCARRTPRLAPHAAELGRATRLSSAYCRGQLSPSTLLTHHSRLPPPWASLSLPSVSLILARSTPELRPCPSAWSFLTPPLSREEALPYGLFDRSGNCRT